MAFRKSTLRQMSPTSRKVARLIGELASVERRLKNLLPEIKQIEFEAQALKTAKELNEAHQSIPFGDLDVLLEDETKQINGLERSNDGRDNQD